MVPVSGLRSSVVSCAVEAAHRSDHTGPKDQPRRRPLAHRDLDGKVALITGAAGGIGQALARAFTTHGMRVGICDLMHDSAATLARELGPERALAVDTDVSDPAACARAVDAVAARFGALHVLVNNAGLGMGLVRHQHMDGATQIEDVSVELWQRFLTTNASGAFFMAKAAMPHLRRQRWGRIINVTTSFFTMLRGGFAPYGPAKAALEAWSASLSKELAGSGITVNVVVPGGPADTPMVPVESFPDRGALVRPERMAPPMLYLCGEAGGAVTGRRFVAADWDPALPDEAAAQAAGAPIGWPDLAQNPVWPGGKPTDG
jgi:NAD(P)-dependent dehydrogenase (short-subunit alcohol dehydrogenase family)